MSAVLVLVLRILLVASLYGFLGWALFTIWKDLQAQTLIFKSRQIPPITLLTFDLQPTEPRQFKEGVLVIGRDSNCDLSLEDETVSARHARLSYHHNQWWLEDLQSTNGTFLNNELVETPTVIISGDKIRCGQAELTIQI
jgi:pSer/pThr/pTyr-binding forkhead associated (FHA) protein